MSHDLILGFRRKPTDLDTILAQLGFKHKENFTAGDLPCRSYRFYEVGRSLCPVEFLYQDGIKPESWEFVDNTIVAEASIVAKGDPGTFDFQKQMEFAKYLRNHYSAILMDPQQMDKDKCVIRD